MLPLWRQCGIARDYMSHIAKASSPFPALETVCWPKHQTSRGWRMHGEDGQASLHWSHHLQPDTTVLLCTVVLRALVHMRDVEVYLMQNFLCITHRAHPITSTISAHKHDNREPISLVDCLCSTLQRVVMPSQIHSILAC